MKLIFQFVNKVTQLITTDIEKQRNYISAFYKSLLVKFVPVIQNILIDDEKLELQNSITKGDFSILEKIVTKYNLQDKLFELALQTLDEFIKVALKSVPKEQAVAISKSLEEDLLALGIAPE